MPAAPLPANRSRNARAAQVRLEDREQGLLHAVAERPRALARAGRGGSRAPCRRSPGRRQPSPSASSAASPDEIRRSQPASSSWRSASTAIGQRAARVEQRLRVRARLDRELAVRRLLERGDPQPRQAALGEAEHVALAAQLQVALRELEPVADLGDRLEPRLGRPRRRCRRRGRSTTRRSRGRPGRAAGGAGRARTGRRHSMTIIVASGTSTPTSTTVVPTSTSSSPSRNRAISASRSAAFRRPWTSPPAAGRAARRSALRLGLGGDRALASRRPTRR